MEEIYISFREGKELGATHKACFCYIHSEWTQTDCGINTVA